MSLQDVAGVVSKEGKPPADRKLGLALLVIATAQLMLVLDGTIVNVALPSIQRSLHLSATDLNWVITAYALAFGGLLLVGGRAGDLFGRKKVFRFGLILFSVASLIGGIANTEAMLIIGRSLQGVGAAIAAPTALSLLAATFPAGPERNKALGVYGAMGGLGSVVGLLLGGLLTEYLSWRWVLFVNIPIAILVIIGSSVLVEGDRERGGIDLPGGLTATLGLVSLVFAINRTIIYGWNDSTVIVCLIIAAVLLIAFGIIQSRSSTAMMPPRVLKDRGRMGANSVMFLMGAGMFATFYFLTLYMQLVKGYSPMRAGIVYLPFAIGIGLGAGGIGPQLLTKMSERAVTVLGLVIASIGMVWFSLLTPTMNPWSTLLPAQLIAGIGLGFAFVTTTVVAVRGVDPRDIGVASGLINTSQQVGGAVGLATLVAIAAAVTKADLPGKALPDALTHGYTFALGIGAVFYVAALIVAAVTLKSPATSPALAEGVPA